MAIHRAIQALLPSYVLLQEQLEQLAVGLHRGELEPRQAIALGQQLTQFWQTHLASATGEDLPPQVFAPWQSLHIEIHRELRLVNVDLMFLARSRTPATLAQKQQAVGDRLNKLQQYGDRLIQTLTHHQEHQDTQAT